MAPGKEGSLGAMSAGFSGRTVENLILELRCVFQGLDILCDGGLFSQWHPVMIFWIFSKISQKKGSRVQGVKDPSVYLWMLSFCTIIEFVYAIRISAT